MPRSHPSSHDGPYASYVDLFIGLIFLFLIIVCLLILQQGMAKAESEQRVGAYVKGLAKELTEQGISVEAHGSVLRFPDGILFATKDYELSPQAETRVRKLRGLLRRDALAPKNADCTGGCKAPLAAFEGIVVEGHADGRPFTGTGPVRDNLALSVLRASAVHRELIGAGKDGWPRGGLDPAFVSAAGFGASRPLPGTAKDRDEPTNRRIEIRFLLKDQ